MCDECGCGVPGDRRGVHEKEGASSTRTIAVEQGVLDLNREHAERIRQTLLRSDSRMVNIIGGPGCGKTELLASLLGIIRGKIHCAVIEGDLATENDAERIRKTGAPVHQVQTGTTCHLSARDVEHGMSHLPIHPKSLVIVENVGNLVCPSMFQIGESLRMVCISVTEGTDKPQKYPVSFREADLAIVTKADLLKYVDFDLEQCRKMVEQIKPGLPFVVTSAMDGTGLDELTDHVMGMWRE